MLNWTRSKETVTLLKLASSESACFPQKGKYPEIAVRKQWTRYLSTTIIRLLDFGLPHWQEKPTLLPYYSCLWRIHRSLSPQLGLVEDAALISSRKAWRFWHSAKILKGHAGHWDGPMGLVDAPWVPLAQCYHQFLRIDVEIGLVLGLGAHHFRNCWN